MVFFNEIVSEEPLAPQKCGVHSVCYLYNEIVFEESSALQKPKCIFASYLLHEIVLFHLSSTQLNSIVFMSLFIVVFFKPGCIFCPHPCIFLVKF